MIPDLVDRRKEMLSYYEKLVNYWRKGNITDALKCFDK